MNEISKETNHSSSELIACNPFLMAIDTNEATWYNNESADIAWFNNYIQL